MDKSRERMQLLRTGHCDFAYVQDVPGLHSLDRCRVQRTDSGDGEFALSREEPQWSCLLNCHKQTTVNYGPAFDRHREALYNFFLPPTYAVPQPYSEPQLNERRQTSKFDFTINFKVFNSFLFSSTVPVFKNFFI